MRYVRHARRSEASPLRLNVVSDTGQWYHWSDSLANYGRRVSAAHRQPHFMHWKLDFCLYDGIPDGDSCRNVEIAVPLRTRQEVSFMTSQEFVGSGLSTSQVSATKRKIPNSLPSSAEARTEGGRTVSETLIMAIIPDEGQLILLHFATVFLPCCPQDQWSCARSRISSICGGNLLSRPN